MKYVIMCGGFYEQWETPKQLQVVNGEKIVERTIRLLKENGCKDVVISSNDKQFDGLGVPRIEHENSYRYENKVLKGYWVDAYYPHFKRNQKVTFIHGDVYFTEDAIKQIINNDKPGNILFGSKGATVKGKLWGEPFAYVVQDLGTFYDGIKAVKNLQDAGKINRVALSWELYRYLNGIDINTHEVREETYTVIDDGTNDADWEDRLEKLRDRFEVKGNVFTVINLYAIGGGESFLYYLAKKYKDRDITVYYTKGDFSQVERLSRYARVIKYTGQKIKCKRVFFNFNQAYKDNIEADEYYQIIHADYNARNLNPKDDERVKYIAVSKTAAESFKRQTNKKCEVCYNPIDIDGEREPLILISATRLSKGKGRERIERFAKILEAEGVDFLWLIFTNDTAKIDCDNIVYLPPRLNAFEYYPLADWLVQLSDDEAYCYSVVEANKMGVPCITTPCPVFKEIGIKGLTVPFDFKDLPIDKITKGMKVTYTEPADKWGELLTKDKSTYEPPDVEKTVAVEVIQKYIDIITGEKVEKGTFLRVPKKRAKQLVEKKVARYER